MKIKTYLDSYLNIQTKRDFMLTAGARERLMKEPKPDLFASAIIVREFSRISYGHVEQEKFCFETWRTMLRRVPKKKIAIRLPFEVWFTAEKIYSHMYGSPTNFEERHKMILVLQRYLAYLISHGLLMLSCNESGVAK